MTSQSLESNFGLSRTFSVFVMPDTSTDPPNTIVRLGEKRGVEEKVMFGLEIIAAVLLVASFTALQFGWLLETAMA